jgi:anti-sigma factor RsiW
MHPERLLWYACGRLDPDEVEDVERHLALCKDCRDEFRSLRSMARSLRRASDAGHPACADLVAYHGDERSLPPHDAARISAHLRVCAACEADLTSLDRAAAVGRRRWEDGAAIADPAAPRAPVVPVATSSWSRGVGRLAATAAMVMVVLTLPPRPTVSTVTFVPILRSRETVRRPVGLGALRVNVVLPSQAPPARYTTRVRSLDPSVGQVYAHTGRAGPEVPLVLEIPGFPTPGRYVLEMEAAGDGGRYTYPFDVVRWP